jgi:hypothetical protein
MAVSALNPNHIRILEVLLAYRQSYLQQTLVEWSRPPLWGPPYGFPVLLWGAAAVLAVGWRKVKRSDWILFALFAAAALTAFRNIVLVAFLGPVLIASYWPWRRPLPAVASPLAAAALLLAFVAGVWQGKFFQLRAAVWRFPEGAAQFLLANRITEPMFNTYEYGGYLMWRLWPHQKTFIDGRALNESVYQDYQRVIAEGRDVREAVLAHYGVGVLVLNAFEYTTGVVYPLVVGLADRAETNWQLVYQDPQALVFVRHPRPGMPVLDRSQVVAHLEAECRLHIERDPELCLCARTLGFLFLNAGDRRRAQESLALYLTSPHEPDAEAEAAYRRLVR